MVAGLDGTVSLFAGAIALGVVHGAEPGHGWPVAAAYALDHERRWFHGFAASFLLGLGHLISSIAVVAVFFLAKDYFEVTQLGWVRYVAGVLLIALGIREYRHGHSHGHGDHSHDHSHSDDGHSHGDDGHSHGHSHSLADDHGHSHDGGFVHSIDTAGGDDSHAHDAARAHAADGAREEGGDAAAIGDRPGAWEQFVAAFPLVGDGSSGHAHLSAEDVDRQGLAGIVGTAFVLGFAHEEEFEIIGLCLGSSYCLELMLAYALAVLVALVALTLVLIAGFEHYGERAERYAEYFPTVSAVVLVALGLGFILGVV